MSEALLYMYEDVRASPWSMPHGGLRGDFWIDSARHTATFSAGIHVCPDTVLSQDRAGTGPKYPTSQAYMNDFCSRPSRARSDMVLTNGEPAVLKPRHAHKRRSPAILDLSKSALQNPVHVITLCIPNRVSSLCGL
jgi:hypothetical protein